MCSIDHVGQRLLEHMKVEGVAFTFQEDNGVDLLLGAQVDDSIQALKALFLDDKGFHIGLEVPVVDREPKQVQAERGNILRIVSSEEIFQETIKEVYIRFLSKHIADGLS